MLSLMKLPISTFLFIALLTMSGCSTQVGIKRGSETSLKVGPKVPPELSTEMLASANYTLIDPAVRHALTEAGEDFIVPIRGGSYHFPPSALVGHYSTVSVDAEHVTYGDLSGDGIPDALVRVTVGTDEFATTELAAFTASGGMPHQFAAFPLGRSIVRSVEITSGKIRVNFTHEVPGDPGIRNTELMLEIPKK